MTKPPHIAVVVNLFHPQTGEECIIQPVVDALGSKQCFKNCLNQLLTAFFILGLYLKLRQHILILYVHIYIYLYIYLYLHTLSQTLVAEQINIKTQFLNFCSLLTNEGMGEQKCDV